MKTILGLITIFILGLAIIGQTAGQTSTPKRMVHAANAPPANRSGVAKNAPPAPKPPQPKTQCKLTKDAAPTLRKFKLGQSLEEIISWMPRLREVYLKSKLQFPERAKIGSVRVWSYDTTPDGARLTGNLHDLDDVDFSLEFLDEKLVRIFMSYTDFKPDNLELFLKQIGEKTTLEKEFWVAEDPHNAVAQCIGFSARVSAGKDGKSSEKSYTTLSLSDATAVKEYLNRLRGTDEKAKALELEKLKAEELKKKTFKP